MKPESEELKRLARTIALSGDRLDWKSAQSAHDAVQIELRKIDFSRLSSDDAAILRELVIVYETFEARARDWMIDARPFFF